MSEQKSTGLMTINYLKIFFRRKDWFIIPLFLGLILGVCSGLVIPKKYKSSTVLLVEDGKNDNPFFEKLAVSTNVEQRLSTIRESMLGWNSLVELVKRLDLDKDIKTPQQLESLVLSIRKDIKIKMKGNNIIDLSYIGKEPELTQAVVKNITEIFIERNLEIQSQETGDAIAFIEEQLKLYEGRIKSAEISAYKEQLDTLLIDSTENHPKVKELRSIIQSREQEMRSAKLVYTENISLDDGLANPIINEIRRALNGIESSAGRDNQSYYGPSITQSDFMQDMLNDPVEDVIARDLEVNQAIYNELLERLESAKITYRLQSSKEGTKYTVLDPPRLPLSPSWPNLYLIAGMGLALGGGLGFGLVVIREFFDRSFIDLQDAKQFLGKPLLGGISKIMTEETVRRERERVIWTYGLTILVGIMFVVGAMSYVNFMQ